MNKIWSCGFMVTIVLLAALTCPAQEKPAATASQGTELIGDATPADVVQGKTFSSRSGSGLTGERSPGLIRKTGQTKCYNEAGEEIPCAGTGQDGEFQAGVDITPRFVDNKNGTVTDRLTGLIWLQDFDCATFFKGDETGVNYRTWQQSLDAAKKLASGYCGLTDGSAAGDWRMPNKMELQSLMDYSYFDPSLPPDHPFKNIVSDNYWSSTNGASDKNGAALVGFYYGFDAFAFKFTNHFVCAVRGGL